MYEIKVISDFSSAHMLRGYEGKCENMHGHNWKIEVVVSSEKLDKLGMVVDFKELKHKLKIILEELDHKNLNDIEYFKKINPTSENIAKYIFDKLATNNQRPATKDQRPMTNDQRLTTKPGRPKVTVWESDNTSATYSET